MILIREAGGPDLGAKLVTAGKPRLAMFSVTEFDRSDPTVTVN